jgi:magnesium-transporting ATPase (P-type)
MSQPNDIAEIPPAGKNDIQIVDDGPVYQMTFNGGDQQLITNYVYPTNYIRTTKYTAISFLPVNLFNQFRRFSNIYFLIAAIFAFFRNASAISPVTQVSPLIFVLLATAIKDGLEDYNRYKSDKQANSAPFEVIRNSQLMKVVSKDIQVGDIVWVRKGEVFPADLILLSSSFTDGTCFVETSQLDGYADTNPIDYQIIF